jgi:nucleotide-binding universal stress UspA family protein
MGFKDILVSVDASDRGRERMEFAIRLAQRHRAHLVGYYTSPTTGLLTGEGLPHGAAPETAAETLAEAAEQSFQEHLDLYGLQGSWLLSADPPAPDVIRRIRVADLAILGLGDPDREIRDPQGFAVEDVVLDCGRPVLGVPIANLPAQLGRSVLIAWDSSREASRALNDALPLLVEAEQVVVLTVDADERVALPGELAAEHLRRHGVNARAQQSESGGLDVGGAILSQADYLHADLVVAGAYGHSRLSEAVLGGASRSLLRQMMVPVLISH